MNNNLKKTFAAAIISTSLLTFTLNANADDVQSSIVNPSVTQYQLNASLQVEIKSLFNESTSSGVKMGAVVRLQNNSNSIARVPDYELRGMTDDGVQYTLQPSASNDRSIQPKEKVELSYMTTIDRQEKISFTHLAWVDVDMYTYPKTETSILSISTTAQDWKGTNSAITDPSAIKKWTEPFTIPGLTSPLSYITTDLTLDNTAQGPVSVVTILVENGSTQSEIVPDFSIEGKSDKLTYSGKRVEQTAVTLEAGEKKYIHYAITTDKGIELRSLNVLTPENFVPIDAKAQPASISYNVRKLNILLPIAAEAPVQPALQYVLKSPMQFDSISHFIDSSLEVSMVELNMHENQSEGYKTAVAKFKLSNRGVLPIPAPLFQTELRSADGYSYSGTRQTAAAQSLMPNLSYVVSYSFALPKSEAGDNLTLKLLDAQTAAPYKTTVAAYKVAVQKQALENELLSFYPFMVKLNNWSLSPTSISVQGSGLTSSYKLKLDLDIQRGEDVLVDQNSGKMLFELVDTLGRTLGSQAFSFTGVNRLVTGEQIINLSNIRTEQQQSPLTIKVYELIDTPAGEAKRLVTTLQQK